MYQKTYSTALIGLTGINLEIECFISGGLPSFSIIGVNPSAAVASRERIRSAMKSCGFSLPASRITVNVRPLDARFTENVERAPWLDLPIALCILACQSLIPSSPLTSSAWLGELSLSGDVKTLYGALTMTRCLKESTPFPNDDINIYLPFQNAAEAALCPGVRVHGLRHLSQAIDMLRDRRLLNAPSFPSDENQEALCSASSAPSLSFSPEPSPLFDEISGQGIGKRAVTIAAAGMHNLLLIGPPGCGKTMLVSTLPSLLPPLSYRERLELTEIYSCKQMLPDGCLLIDQRPFRAPHHTITAPSLLGGGAYPVPGEASLAHHGVLFLDEFPELQRASLEALREPLEDHSVRISRLHGTYSFPADFVLAAGMNPCPCGFYPDKSKCHCSEKRVQDYYGRIDSPLLDRMDLILHLESVKAADMGRQAGLSYHQARKLVETAFQKQRHRFKQEGTFNSRMNVDMIKQYCRLSPEDEAFLKGACEHFGLSMRAYHKILRVARTIADMEGSDQIRQQDLLEALQYRTALK